MCVCCPICILLQTQNRPVSDLQTGPEYRSKKRQKCRETKMNNNVLRPDHSKKNGFADEIHESGPVFRTSVQVKQAKDGFDGYFCMCFGDLCGLRVSVLVGAVTYALGLRCCLYGAPSRAKSAARIFLSPRPTILQELHSQISFFRTFITVQVFAAHRRGANVEDMGYHSCETVTFTIHGTNKLEC